MSAVHPELVFHGLRWGSTLSLLRSEIAPPPRWFGVALAAVAFTFATLARIQLGRFFSVKAQPKGLVTHGLYARLRHPMFLFVDLTIVGLALAQPLLLAILLVLAPIQILRARKEDRLMEEKFGEAYRDYRKHTWF
jgi:protein-S-isoprenylcysteine O-methyltransferase Ste14